MLMAVAVAVAVCFYYYLMIVEGVDRACVVGKVVVVVVVMGA